MDRMDAGLSGELPDRGRSAELAAHALDDAPQPERSLGAGNVAVRARGERQRLQREGIELAPCGIAGRAQARGQLRRDVLDAPVAEVADPLQRSAESPHPLFADGDGEDLQA